MVLGFFAGSVLVAGRCCCLWQGLLYAGGQEARWKWVRVAAGEQASCPRVGGACCAVMHAVASGGSAACQCQTRLETIPVAAKRGKPEPDAYCAGLGFRINSNTAGPYSGVTRRLLNSSQLNSTQLNCVCHFRIKLKGIYVQDMHDTAGTQKSPLHFLPLPVKETSVLSHTGSIHNRQQLLHRSLSAEQLLSRHILHRARAADDDDQFRKHGGNLVPQQTIRQAGCATGSHGAPSLNTMQPHVPLVPATHQAPSVAPNISKHTIQHNLCSLFGRVWTGPYPPCPGAARWQPPFASAAQTPALRRSCSADAYASQ